MAAIDVLAMWSFDKPELSEQRFRDYLAIDALHMMPFVETDKQSAWKWNQQALDVLVASMRPDARKWEGSLRNNTGYALYRLGRYDEALAIQLRLEQESDAAGAPDQYVFEELVELYKAKSDTAKVGHYAARLQATRRATAK